MFLIVTGRAAQPPRGASGLAHARFQLNDQLACDVYHDASRFSLEATGQQIALTDRLSPGDTVFTLAGGTAVVRKPLMLGLPVYYVASEQRLVASPKVTLLRSMGVTLEEDERLLPELFLYRYITPPRTPFRGISCLPIDGSIDVRGDGPALRVGALNGPHAFSHHAVSLRLNDGAAKIADDLESTIASLGPRRESVGCLLSGGVDSSILFFLAKQRLGLNRSFSAGYPFEDAATNDERKYAETASAAMGSVHQYHEFSTGDFLTGTIDAIAHAEIPVVALQSVLIELLCSQGLPKDQTVVLCGQGADGLFGLSVMYNHHKYGFITKRAFSPLLWLLARTVGARKGGRTDKRLPFGKLYAYSRRRWDLDFSRVDNALWMLGEFGDKAWIKERFNVDDEALLQGRLGAISRIRVETMFDALSVMDFISDVTTIQDAWGKMAAAHGRSMVYSFNSPGLIRAASQTSWDDKLDRPKQLIRTVGRRIGVPEFILSRPKRGFGIRADRWALKGGILEPLIAIAAPVVGLDILQRFQSADEVKAMTCWTLVNYAIWKRLIVQGESADSLRAELRTALAHGAASPVKAG